MTVDSDNYVLDLDFNQDFRYFLWNSDTYNDELCTMSLIMSNLAQNKRITIKQGTINYGSNLSIQNYMSKLGFYNIQSENISYDGVTANVYIGYKTIDYYRKKRGVIGIFIGGLNNDKANDKMALTPENLTESNNYYNIIAEKIREKVNIDRLGETELFNCYWISGKGIAGGVVAELAYLYGTEEVYCYTFGSPYTHKGSGNPPATYVKNVINEDDPLIKKNSDENDYIRLGEIYNASIKLDYMDKYRTYIGVSPSEYKGDCSRMNTMISQFIKFVKGEPSTREVLLAALSKNTGNGSTSVIMSPLTTVVNDATIEISNTNDAQKDASSFKSYYVLSKVLEGINKSVGKDEKYNGVNVSPQSDKEEGDKWGNGNTKVADALKLIGTWYCDNVYTYEAGHKDGDTPEGWKARFYDAIEDVHTQETRRGMAKNTSNSIQNRLNHINEWNEGKLDTEKFTDDCDIIQQRVQWNDRFLAAEAYTWQNSDGAYGKYECEHFTDNGYPNNKMSDDCSGFALMVLDYATGGALYNELGSTIYSCGNNSLCISTDDNKYVKALGNNKFERKRVTTDMDMSYLQSGDLLVANNHCEFFYRDGTSNKQFGWGSPKVAFPNKNFNINKDKNKLFYTDGTHNYVYIYRLVE